jgi:hypothetical protein
VGAEVEKLIAAKVLLAVSVGLAQLIEKATSCLERIKKLSV